ncbi:MAG: rhamnogalacturonan acetylesterase [Prevotella sp.]|nr:rhamnogalacturonan acetylesterase [Prevotella sp.]
MKKYKWALVLLTIVLGVSSFKEDKVTTVFMIGDSTMANKDISDDKQERGWGMVLQSYFTDDIRVENHAVNGRSSKSFIDEGRWQKVVDRIKPGDYVFIQFGHNDEKAAEDRHTDPGTTFDANLKKFVVETREKGGIPVLFNAVVRRNFYKQVSDDVDDESLRNTTFADLDEKVNSDTLIDTHGAYLLSPYNVAKEMHVPFVNANRVTHDLEQSLGIEGSRRLHMWFKPNEHPSVPKGRKDNTHYNIYGAHVVAGLLIDEIGRQVPALTPYIRHYDIAVAKDGSGHFFELQKAVDLALSKKIPSSTGRGLVPAGRKITILVGEGEWNRPTIPSSSNIEIVKRENTVFR